MSFNIFEPIVIYHVKYWNLDRTNAEEEYLLEPPTEDAFVSFKKIDGYKLYHDHSRTTTYTIPIKISSLTEEIKRRVLSKLTEEERKVLGF
jgi:hypothetical protein